MLKKNRLTMAVSAALGMGATALPAAVNAQEELMVEEVVVTGSRIQKANLVSTSPVTQVDAEAFKFQGTTRVEDLISDLPAVYPGNSAGDANGATGTATIDLRNLGDQRTLVLMNGRRLPPGSPVEGGAGSDINQIPGALIERVEVLTGGASSTYGSDAVAGVVNFIMVDDFEGVKLDVQYSGYQHDNDNSWAQQLQEDAGFDFPDGSETDGEISDISFIIGANLDGGRGNVTGYATYRKINEIRQGSRDYASCALGTPSGVPATPDNAVCGGSSTVPWGRFTDFGTAEAVDENGNPVYPGASSFDYSIGGNGNEFVPFDTLYNYAPDNFFQRPDERYTGGVFGRYTINEHVEVYSEVTFMDDRSNAQIAPSGAFFVTSQLSCGNPFLSDQQFDLLCAQNGFTEDDFAPVYIGRRNVEGGARNDDLRHTNFRGVFGARGDINDVWRYDVYGSYAETSYEETYNNDLSSTAVRRALDAVELEDGTVTCRSVVDGSDPNCVPWNVFQDGAVTDEMLDYLYLPLFARGTVDQKVFSGFVAGDLGNYGVQLPSADTGINVVLGAEYRSENLDYSPDAGFQSGDGAGQGGPILPVQGGYDVKEVFTELNIPLVENAPFAQELTLDLGYRYSEYDVDTKNDTTTTDTYKVAGSWSPTNSLKFRASFNRAIRHANIRELFRPLAIGLFDMNEDPCAGENPTASLEQCARTGVTASQYGRIADSPAGQYNAEEGGNVDLAPEESDTYSMGLVFSPENIEDLTVTLDYFDIEIEGAIDSQPEFILDSCLESGDPVYCDAVNRNPVSGTLWVGQDNVFSPDSNIGFLSTKGFDIQVDYTLGLGDMGSLAFNNVGTYLTEWDRQDAPDAEVTDCLGVWGANCGQPIFEFQNNLRATWLTPWQMSLSAQWRYVDSVDDITGNGWDFEEQNYFDLSAIWDINDMLSLRAGVNNVTDEDPPLGPAPGPSIRGNGNTFPGTYDALGRYWFMGATVQF